jgi:hypothetical protein
MSNYNFGNFNRERDYNLYQIRRSQQGAPEANTDKSQEKNMASEQQVYEQKKTDASSLDALSNYAFALSGLNGKKTDLSALGLSLAEQVKIEKYINPQQQARIEQDMLKYFA